MPTGSPTASSCTSTSMSEDSPFSRLTWSPDGSLLAFTAGTGDLSGPADVWIFYADAAEPTAGTLTQTGAGLRRRLLRLLATTTCCGSASPEPIRVTYGIAVGPEPSHRRSIRPSGRRVASGSVPAGAERGQWDCSAVWHGQMSADGGGGWNFVRGGMLYLAQADADGASRTSGRRTSRSLTPSASSQVARPSTAPASHGRRTVRAWRCGMPSGPERSSPKASRMKRACTTAILGRGFKVGPAQALDEADTDGTRGAGLAGGRTIPGRSRW